MESFKVGDRVRFRDSFRSAGGNLHGAEGVVVAEGNGCVGWRPESPRAGARVYYSSSEQLERMGGRCEYSVGWR